MASGLAIVSADTDSSRQLIEQGRSGLLCADLEDVVEGVIALAGDADMRQQTAAEARVSSARFSWDAASDSVLDAYRSVLQSKRA